MKKYIFSFILVCLLAYCKKPGFDDLSGTATLTGVSFIYDTLSGVTYKTPLKNAKVFIKKDDGSDGFLYSVNSNSQGEYSFSGIDEAKKYIVYASTDTGVVKYYGELPYGADYSIDNKSDTLKLFPDSTNQNGIHLIVQDITGSRVSGVTAWVFNSPILFAQDTSAGKIFDMATNPYGISNKFNIAAGTYYLRVKTRIGNLDLIGEQSVTVKDKGIAPVTITLQNAALNRNGIEVNTFDIFNTPISGAKIYCYRSYSVFLADTINFNNSLFTMTSNNAGKATAYVIEPAVYYLRAVKTINSQTLTQTATVTVNSNSVATANMILQ
jgi:hypothetical protein